MPIIPLERVALGMRTAAPVVDPGGMLLVRQGTEITAELLDRLKLRRVVSVDVYSADSRPSSVREALDPAAAEAALNHAFEKVSDNSVMKSLLEAAVARIRSGEKKA